MSLRMLIVLASITWTAGCGILEAGTDDAVDDLRRARAAWERAAIDDYDLAMRRLCFCWTPIDVTVVVRGGERVAVLYVSDGTPAPVAAEIAQYYPTVDELFDRVDRALRESADEVRVTYHATLGYPVDLWIDQSRAIADEEEGFEVELQVVDPG
ncbi:MAG: hypothetical protein KJO11_07765 [Gemmatimonadetes bacterium]|nr:hypothetical protein [Gemmatimonadota bacterium]MBT8404943.1 hypothetical protein [Gemmatimonadota bacterium]NNK64829.1 hypothetical protein [Gemmatimonadota bacterium]